LKPEAAGHRSPAVVCTADPDVLWKRRDESFEEASWQRGRAEVAHVPGEHVVESVDVFEPEAESEAVLLRVAHFPPHV